MKIQYASDLHLEFLENKSFLTHRPLQAIGDVLILAGDIVPFAVIDRHKDFFSYISDHFEISYWIPGNHEYYYFNMKDKETILNEKIKENVYLVNNVAIDHKDIHFIFSTLWSKISKQNELYIERGMSDFHVIKKDELYFSVKDFNCLHEESLSFISSELQKKQDKKQIVATHHLPTFINYPERYKSSILNEAFAVELKNLIEETKPEAWIYGHSHYNTPEFKIGNTQMLSNQLGYVKQNEHKSFICNKTFIL